MKLSLDWINDYVKLPGDIEISKLMHDLTMSTVEVEGAENLSETLAEIVVGKVIEILPHPNADKLRICRTDTGDGDIKEIVCGGINLKEGMKAAVAKLGARVRWHGEGDLVEIKNAKLRGIESYGMICASSEIGLFDLFPFEEQGTIVDLSAFDAPPGTPVADALGIDDVILEIDNKSLTNRPDLWGHYGIARELSAIYDLPLAPLPEFTPPGSDGGLRITIEDSDRCPRYAGVKIEGVSTKEASFKVRSRIWRVGMRPINAIVDITNYVMLATGQPTHAFDSGNIKGGITVRRARDAEKLLLLNGREIELSTDNLVIADDREAVALAGVMGGGKDSILPETESVILEVANFDALGTRKTSQRFELRTEASIRYEKGIDPQRVDQATGLSAHLFASEFPEARVTGYVDSYPKELKPTEVELSLSWLSRRMGKHLSGDTIKTTLERLGFSVEISAEPGKFGQAGDKLRVVSPSWRSTGDISLPDDIMEETARLYGYENFETAPIEATFTRAINQRDVELERRIREYLSFRCGMQEIFTYPWVRDAHIEAVGDDASKMLEIAAPPAPDERRIRRSLLPNLIAAVSSNARYQDEFAIYELACVFSDENYVSAYDDRERLPQQRRSLAGAAALHASGQESIASLFRRTKGVIENMARCVHMEPLSFAQADSVQKPLWTDDVVRLGIFRGDKCVGKLGLLSKKAAMAFNLKKTSVMLFEIDVDELKPLASRSNRFVHLPEYPQVEYDISMLFDDEVKWMEIENAITGKKGPDDLLRSVAFVDEYRGRQIPQGKKSVTLRLVIGSDKKTLTSEEIEHAAGVASKRLSKQLGGVQRG